MKGHSTAFLLLCFSIIASADTKSLRVRFDRDIKRSVFDTASVRLATNRKLVQSSDASKAIPNEYICILSKSGMELSAASQDSLVNSLSTIVDKNGGVVTNEFHESLLGLSIANMNDEGLETLLENYFVEFCEQNQRVSILGNNNISTSLWGLDSVDGEIDGSYVYGNLFGTGVDVYVIDSGIYVNHEDFNGRNIKCLYDAYNENCKDENGHGTHVAGTIGGIYSGVAKNVNLISVRVLDKWGGGSYAGTIAAIEKVIEAVKSSGRPSIVNLSLGGPISDALNIAVNDASDLDNLIFVVAAGNSNEDACNISPASAKKAFTVASVDSSPKRSSFSNYGKCVNIFGPGDDIKSADIDSVSDYRVRGGTSMASPHVVGALALYWERYPGKKAKRIINKLLNAAVNDTIDGLQDTNTPNVLVSTEQLLRRRTNCSSIDEFCLHNTDCCNGNATSTGCQDNKCVEHYFF